MLDEFCMCSYVGCFIIRHFRWFYLFRKGIFSPNCKDHNLPPKSTADLCCLRSNAFTMAEAHVAENPSIAIRNFAWYSIPFFSMGILEFGGIFGMQGILGICGMVGVFCLMGEPGPMLFSLSMMLLGAFWWLGEDIIMFPLSATFLFMSSLPLPGRNRINRNEDIVLEREGKVASRMNINFTF